MAASPTPTAPYPFGPRDPNAPITDLHAAGRDSTKALLIYCKETDIPPPKKMDRGFLIKFFASFYDPCRENRALFQDNHQVWLHQMINGPWTNYHALMFWRVIYQIVYDKCEAGFVRGFTKLFDVEVRDFCDEQNRKAANDRRLRMEARANRYNFRRDHTLRGVCREYLRLTNYTPRGRPNIPKHGPVVRGGYCAECVCTCDSPNDAHCSHYCKEGCPAGKCETPEHRACLMGCGCHRRHTEMFCTPCQVIYHRKWFSLSEDNGLPIYNAERKRRGLLLMHSANVREISLDD